jgi:hypothetical protein
LAVEVVVDGVAAVVVVVVVVVVVDLGPLPGLGAAVVVVVVVDDDVDGEVGAGVTVAVVGVVDVVGGPELGTVVGDEVGRCPAVVVTVALDAFAGTASDTPASVAVRLA